MKLKDVLKEYQSAYQYPLSAGNYDYASYMHIMNNKRRHIYNPKLTAQADYDHEIEHGIDILFTKYPEIMKNKTVKRYLIQMVIGKVYSGEVAKHIDLNRFIKRLRKRGIKVN